MSYISEIFKRLDLQQICSFLMNGADTEVSEKSYIERIREAEQPLFEVIRERFNDTEENESFAEQIMQYGGTHAEVHMEIGMICGASLITQLLAVPKDG